ncbi:restriction endonuclease subunit S [Deltaproteobacteria bacterium OttesenSCG-928-M10]|nr:restriction endonuclease subunit S [Deltaproteobacteria bacterium OttesenSCG-928-M10]
MKRWRLKALMMFTEYPATWEKTTIANVYNIISGGTPDTKVPDYWNGTIPWISSADISDLGDVFPRRYITQNAVTKSATNIAPAGSLLVVTRVGLGKVSLATQRICFSQDIQALIGNDSLVYPKYAHYYLAKAVQVFKHKNQGTTISGVTKKHLSDLPFFLPPYKEQIRIVSKIENLFSNLDAGVASLERAKAKLTQYRAALLQAAVEGQLNKHHAYSWRHYSMQELVFQYQNGIAKRSGTTGTEYKVLRLADIQNNAISESNPRHIHLSDKEIARYRLNNGDLVAIRVNGSKDLVGRLVYVRDEKDWAYCDHFIRLRIDERKAHPKFIKFLFDTKKFRNKIQELMVSSAGQNTISQSSFNEITVRVPSLDEQKIIISQIERYLGVIFKIEQSLNRDFTRASRLRQAILKKAFEGNLVPQDPNEEPASVLLERIQRERERATPTSVKRKASKKNLK